MRARENPATAMAAAACTMLAQGALAAAKADPFAILDLQTYVLPADMTWADFVAPPNTNWSDPSVKGSERNFNIALVVVDYPDREFVISQAPNSTVFGNPMPIVSGLDRSEVPAFYRDFLNLPQELNRNHTLHEYWMEDSGGRYGVDLTAFGAYRLPANSYQYGVDDVEDGGFNPGACPEDGPCSIDLRTDAFAAWRADVGNETADSFELTFILSAGQDESSTWQEFGEMKFSGPEDVPDSFGPPDESIPNYAKTRYVNWTSWASASVIWPNAGGGSSTQAESSGMATYAHELTHLLGIGDNYNNPFGEPPRRSYTGPWSMLSRGSFNGPGGPHTRWQIPAQQGGSLGSLHTMGDKLRISLVDPVKVLNVSRDALPQSGLVVAEIKARSVNPGDGELMGLKVLMGDDLSPECDPDADPLCDAGGYNNYDLQVVDRMGADSFTPDSGVMISKTKDVDDAPFEWMIDANPQDINLVDFVRPNGSDAYITIGDYRQLADALFHAGTRSGSLYEHVDESNCLHLYVIDIRRDDVGVLYYTVGVRSLDGSGASTYGVELAEGTVVSGDSPQKDGVTCEFELTNSGTYVDGGAGMSSYFQSDIYRLSVKAPCGWTAVLPNELATAAFGSSTTVKVGIKAAPGNGAVAKTVKLTATSEADPSVSATATCLVAF